MWSWSHCDRVFVLPGSSRYRILPLHSQIPREEQRRVFEPVPDNVTKVWTDGPLPILPGKGVLPRSDTSVAFFR